ncbi:hypothetical protein U1Q18_031381, partial [Sarracenia purpurea var. burkii]
LSHRLFVRRERMRRCRASVISLLGREGEEASTNRNTCHRLGEASMEDGVDANAHYGRGATGRCDRGAKRPVVEEAPAVDKVYRPASVFDKGNTGISFIKHGLVERDNNVLWGLSTGKIVFRFYRLISWIF